MNIRKLSLLSSVLMYAHDDISRALGRLVGGTADKRGVAKDVISAVSKVDKSLVELMESGIDTDMYLDVEIEINTDKVPASVWFEVDVDEPHIVAVVAKGMDVMPLISQLYLDEYKAEFIAECAKRREESEADYALDVFSYED